MQLATRNSQRVTFSRRAIWAWAFYDFANSPFTTTITTVIFNVYFAQVVAQNAPVYGDTLWGFLVAASTLISGALSPLLGAFADERRWKKKLLGACALVGSLATAGLAWATPETLVLTSVLFMLASLAFSCSLAFYNAFLNDLSTSENVGRISGLGWALGYVGGGLCLVVNLLMMKKPQFFGIPDVSYWPIRLGFLVVGLWWGLFTLPIMFWVHEEPASGPAAGERNSWQKAFHHVKKSLLAARTANKELFRYLIAYLLYNDGIETVIVMASLFASQVLFMGQDEIIACFLMIQFVAFFGAMGFGRLGDRWGNKKALQASLVLWAVVLFWALLMKSKSEFWAAGVLIAVVLGGSQSLSRSFFAKLIPQGQEAQFYGFLALSSKISASLGPLTYGLCRQLTGSPRLAILSMLIFFVAGQWLLMGVREPQSGAFAGDKS
ncbi:MAG: MFS transporter [Elusimicrobia bacterium]|nr:MFS transporter [Elusimicrobiota bacterium]